MPLGGMSHETAAFPVWIAATLLAAIVQAVRFYLQKRLASGGLSPAAATFARFVWAPPAIAVGLAAWIAASRSALPAVPAAFWMPAAAGGLAQILATICIVASFAYRNFAVGIALSNTTVLLTVVAGLLWLGEGVTGRALAAMLVGFAGVVILSAPQGAAARDWRVLNRGAALGLAAGAFFAVSAVGYRAASLTIEAPALLRAALTLCLVTLMQTAALGAWLRLREPGAIGAVLSRWRATGLVGAASLLGSLGWFTAYTLQTAAYVNAVGKVELVLSVMISWLVLGERSSPRELAGIALVGLSVVALVVLA